MSLLIAILLIVGGIILVLSIVLGVVTFSPERAEAVRAAEAEQDTVMEQLDHMRHYHPEIKKGERLDRHDSYIWLHIGLWMYGWAVILSPAPNSNLSSLSFGTQLTLGFCLLIGSSLALVGITLGMPLGRRWRVFRTIHINLVSPLLGDDIRFPYSLACAGMLSILVSMGYYAFTLISLSTSRLLGTLGGGLSIAIAMMCLTLSGRLLARIYEYTKAREQLIDEALARIGREQ